MFSGCGKHALVCRCKLTLVVRAKECMAWERTSAGNDHGCTSLCGLESALACTQRMQANRGLVNRSRACL